MNIKRTLVSIVMWAACVCSYWIVLYYIDDLEGPFYRTLNIPISVMRFLDAIWLCALYEATQKWIKWINETMKRIDDAVRFKKAIKNYKDRIK